MQTSAIFNLTILEAAESQQGPLREALRALIPLARQEHGCLDYRLFELNDALVTFYMQESFNDQAALDARFSMPCFKSFAKHFDELLSRPLKLFGLKEVIQPGTRLTQEAGSLGFRPTAHPIKTVPRH